MKRTRLLLFSVALVLLGTLALAEPLPNRGDITWQSGIQEVMDMERQLAPDSPPQHIQLVTGKITSYVFLEHAQLLDTEADVLMYLFHNDEMVQIHYDFYEDMEETGEGGAGYRAMLAKLTGMYGDPLSTDPTESLDTSNMLAEDIIYGPELSQGYHEWMIDEVTKLGFFYRENAYVVSYTNYAWVLPHLEQWANR